MTKKGDNNYPENFETFVVNKLIEHDGRFAGIDEKFAGIEKRFNGIEEKFVSIDERFGKIEKELARHTEILTDHGRQLLKLTEKVDRIDERTVFLPKLYDAVDAFMKEIRESRDERIVGGRKVSDHEERLAVVEDALATTPAERIIF